MHSYQGSRVGFDGRVYSAHIYDHPLKPPTTTTYIHTYMKLSSCCCKSTAAWWTTKRGNKWCRILWSKCSSVSNYDQFGLFCSAELASSFSPSMYLYCRSQNSRRVEVKDFEHPEKLKLSRIKLFKGNQCIGGIWNLCTYESSFQRVLTKYMRLTA